MEKTYSLILEKWISVVDSGAASLQEVFSSASPRALGGTPTRKIASMKLLVAIAQAACTPADDAEWRSLGVEGMSRRVLEYLDAHADLFFLHGDRPFLQYPDCAKAELKPFGTLLPQVASGNTSRLTQLQQEPELGEADRACLLVEQMSFCLGGKKPDKSIVLTKGYEKRASAGPGPSVGFMGFLHSFLTGRTIRESVWLNLSTAAAVAAVPQLESGVGVPPWEEMPAGEDDGVARRLKTSLMGRLVPMARFIWLDPEGLRFTDGVVHPGYKDGFADPSCSVCVAGKEPRVKWTDPEKQPWRELAALLSFLDNDIDAQSLFVCPWLRNGIARLDADLLEQVGIWSGGVRVSSNAGEQYLTGKDDFVESESTVNVALMRDPETDWFSWFHRRMESLDTAARNLYGRVTAYGGALMLERKTDHAAEATRVFWQLVQPVFQEIVDGCEDEEAMDNVFKRCLEFARAAFDAQCPHGTARQIEAWARFRPGMGIFNEAKHKERSTKK